MKDLYSKCIENIYTEENILYKDACDIIEKLRKKNKCKNINSKLMMLMLCIINLKLFCYISYV